MPLSLMMTDEGRKGRGEEFICSTSTDLVHPFPGAVPLTMEVSEFWKQQV
jgi:hypothetical protein